MNRPIPLSSPAVRADYLGHQIDEAERAGVINKGETADLRSYHQKVQDLLSVDDFSPAEISRTSRESPATKDDKKTAEKPAPKRAASSKIAKKKVAKKKTVSNKTADDTASRKKKA